MYHINGYKTILLGQKCMYTIPYKLWQTRINKLKNTENAQFQYFLKAFKCLKLAF